MRRDSRLQRVTDAASLVQMHKQREQNREQEEQKMISPNKNRYEQPDIKMSLKMQSSGMGDYYNKEKPFRRPYEETEETKTYDPTSSFKLQN